MEVHGILVDGFAGLSEIPSLVLFSLIFLGEKRKVIRVSWTSQQGIRQPNIGWSVKFVSTLLLLSPRLLI